MTGAHVFAGFAQPDLFISSVELGLSSQSIDAGVCSQWDQCLWIHYIIWFWLSNLWCLRIRLHQTAASWRNLKLELAKWFCILFCVIMKCSTVKALTNLQGDLGKEYISPFGVRSAACQKDILETERTKFLSVLFQIEPLHLWSLLRNGFANYILGHRETHAMISLVRPKYLQSLCSGILRIVLLLF